MFEHEYSKITDIAKVIEAPGKFLIQRILKGTRILRI